MQLGSCSCCKVITAQWDLQIHKTWKPRLLDSQPLFTKSHGNSMERKVPKRKMSYRVANRGKSRAQHQPRSSLWSLSRLFDWYFDARWHFPAWRVLVIFFSLFVLCKTDYLCLSFGIIPHKRRLPAMTRRKRCNRLNCCAWTYTPSRKDPPLSPGFCATTGNPRRNGKAAGATWKARPRTLPGLRNIWRSLTGSSRPSRSCWRDREGGSRSWSSKCPTCARRMCVWKSSTSGTWQPAGCCRAATAWPHWEP